ncbi:hypothetical protein [Arthrobacter sp. D2-10]
MKHLLLKTGGKVRVSEYYDLDATQGELDFVDVDVSEDVPVFIDPSAIRVQEGEWGRACRDSLVTFFDELLVAIGAGDRSRVNALVHPLVEPNETHLGISEGPSRGRGLGHQKNSDKLVEALSQSKAVTSGLLQDLEDSVLFIEGIGRDIISDITTCVIRAHLIDYTQQMAEFHEIPLESQYSGATWNELSREWNPSALVNLPRPGTHKLLLVPKSVVRVKTTVDRGEYYRGYLRPYFEQEELNDPGSALVRVLKNGRRRVNRTELDRRLGNTKPDAVKNTLRHPTALDDYRAALRDKALSPMGVETFVEALGTPMVDFGALIGELNSISPGSAGATLYHRTIAKLLSALFDTSLGNEHIEKHLHGGLKRIDITYDNVAGTGFFRWLSLNYKAATIVVECKNYSKEIGNAEVDQVAMRLSPHRGEVAFLTCRRLENKPKLLDRCRNVASDGHGFVLALDDEDIAALVAEIEADRAGGLVYDNRFSLLRKRFGNLIG